MDTEKRDNTKSIDELVAENKRLKKTNRFLTAFVIITFVILLYDTFLYKIFN